MAYATLEGTARYKERFRGRAAENHFRLEENLWLSSIGIGTYLGDWDEENDESYSEAVFHAVELGVKVIDTAIYFRFKRCGRSIGGDLSWIAETEVEVADGVF